MKPRQPGQVRLIVLGLFSLAIISRSLVYAIPGYAAGLTSLPGPIAWLEQPLRWMVFCGTGLCLLHGPDPRRWAAELGLTAPPARALAVALVATLPLLLGPFLFGATPHAPRSLAVMLMLAAVWPLAEELLYRGFCFGQLTGHAGLGLWPAAIVTGLVFGTVHLGNAGVQRLPLAGQLGTVALVSVGGLLFCWLFTRWGRNLWAPWAVHGFMNLAWEVWALGDSPLGTLVSNGLRASCVLLAIVLTWRYAPSSSRAHA